VRDQQWSVEGVLTAMASNDESTPAVILTIVRPCSANGWLSRGR
jgi:hypothetical protein